MREVVPPLRIGHLTYYGNCRRGFKDVEQVIFGCLGRPGQDIEVEVPTDNRGHGQHPLGILSEAPNPSADHLAHTVGQHHLLEGGFCDPSPAGVPVDRAGVGEMDE